MNITDILYAKKLAGGGGGGRGANPVNLTWVDLPETFEHNTPIGSFLRKKTEDDYEESECPTGAEIGFWDDEWLLNSQMFAYLTKAEVGEYAFVIQQVYMPYYKIVVKSGDADDSNIDWLEVYGDCTLSIEAVE